jgi:hypothetical protein
MIDMFKGFLTYSNYHHDLVVRRELEEFGEPASVESFHGAGVQSEGFGSNHQVSAG